MVLALGSNLGDRIDRLAFGVRRLEAFVRIARVSSVYASAPAGPVEAQPDFLNAVVLGETVLEPEAVLEEGHRIEAAAGRVRGAPGGPRTLDVDLVLHGDRTVREPGLTVPHPRWRERAFVLAPLAEIDPGRMDPESGRTVHDIWTERRDGLPPVRLVAPPQAIWREDR